MANVRDLIPTTLFPINYVIKASKESMYYSIPYTI